MPASNAVARTVVDYGPDPADRLVLGLGAHIRDRRQGTFVDAVIGADGDPSTSLTGPGPQLQHFRGAATTAGTIIRNGGSADIASGLVEGPNGDPARTIFAARLRRNQAGL